MESIDFRFHLQQVSRRWVRGADNEDSRTRQNLFRVVPESILGNIDLDNDHL